MYANFSVLKKHGEAIGGHINKDTPIYIWGYTPWGVSIYDFLSIHHTDVTIIDQNPHIKQASSPSVLECIHRKGDCVVIIAFDVKYHQFSVDRLRKQGFMVILGGKKFTDFPEAYMASKIYYDYLKYKELYRGVEFLASEDNSVNAICNEWLETAGVSLNDKNLVQDLWGAKKVFEAQPSKHFDIGSSVAGFVCHVLSFGIPVVMVDVRPIDTWGTENLTFIQADATNLEFFSDDSIESLSALCSIEHFGLGRYGDPVNPDAHLMAFKSLQRVLKKGGNLYLSLPVDKECYLRFNQYRVYSPKYVIKQLSELCLVEFSIIKDNRPLLRNASLDAVSGYSFGLFHFKKN